MLRATCSSSRTWPAPCERIAERGPAGFYEGETAALIEKEMEAGGGMITAADLAGLPGEEAHARAWQLPGLRGPRPCLRPAPEDRPSSSMLNLLEGYDLKAMGAGSAATMHLMAEAMRRAYAERARHLGDPDFNPACPWAAPLEGLRGAPAQDHPRGPGLQVRARHLRVAGGERRDHAPLGGGRGQQRGLADLHPRGRLRLEDRGAGRRVSCSTTRWATSTPAPVSRTPRG